jgi:nitroreductase
MDVFEAVDSRIACRAFLDKPVDLSIVRDMIVRAQRSASGGNLQSWNVYALAHEPLAAFKRIVADRIAKDDPRHMKSEYPIYPDPMFGAYKERREAHGMQLYGSLGIEQTDGARRLAQYKKNFEFFNAPVALFITIDRKLGPGQWADLGGYINSLALLALRHGRRIPEDPGQRDAVLRRRHRLRQPPAQGQRLPLAARRTVRVLPVPRIRLNAHLAHCPNRLQLHSRHRPPIFFASKTSRERTFRCA